MDRDDTTADPKLDAFSALLPLPYRLAFLVVLGIWLWGLNLHWLYQLKIDVPHLIRYPARSSHSETPHHLAVYRLATFLSVPLGFGLLIFWVLTRGEATSVLQWSILPNAYLLLLVISVSLPVKILSPSGRSRFLSTLRRISVGGLARSDDGKFGDVLLADALTSYAKPLSEAYVTLCMFVTGQGTTNRPNRDCGGKYMVPILLAVPFLIRLRQCVIDRQSANALKYASAFPAIALSAMQRDAAAFGMTDVALFRLWVFAAMVNSLYSFWWDVQRDWDLTFFSPARNDSTYPYGLRRYRVFKSPHLYYTVIAIDLILRCGIFMLELLEVFRRWMWAFLRIEAEFIRARQNNDVFIQLEDFGSSLEED